MAEQIITKGFKPEKALAYFEELCKIPPGSGNEEQVAKYIENFAKERGLFCIRDDKNNVFIRKEATENYKYAENPDKFNSIIELVQVAASNIITDAMKKEAIVALFEKYGLEINEQIVPKNNF